MLCFTVSIAVCEITINLYGIPGCLCTSLLQLFAQHKASFLAIQISVCGCSYFIANLPKIRGSQSSPSALPRHSSLTDWISMGFACTDLKGRCEILSELKTSAFTKTWFLSVPRVAFCWNSWILKGLLLDMLLKVMLPVSERLPNSCFSQNLKGRSGRAQINGCRKFILLRHWAAFLNISNLLEKSIHSLLALHKITPNKHMWGRGRKSQFCSHPIELSQHMVNTRLLWAVYNSQAGTRLKTTFFLVALGALSLVLYRLDTVVEINNAEGDLFSVFFSWSFSKAEIQ